MADTPLKKFALITEKLEKVTRQHGEAMNTFSVALDELASDMQDLRLDVAAAAKGHWPRETLQ